MNETNETHDIQNNPAKAVVKDEPLTLIIQKTNKENQPLSGAGFSVRARENGLLGALGRLSQPLRFTLTNAHDGDDTATRTYRYDEQGDITTIMVGSDGKAKVIGLPKGEYVLEEVIVPNGYFASVPKHFSVNVENTTEDPVSLVIANDVTVRLGFDRDRWIVPAFVTLTVIPIAGGILLWQSNTRKNRSKYMKQEEV